MPCCAVLCHDLTAIAIAAAAAAAVCCLLLVYARCRYAVETTEIAKLLIVGTAVTKEAELAVYVGTPRRALQSGVAVLLYADAVLFLC